MVEEDEMAGAMSAPTTRSQQAAGQKSGHHLQTAAKNLQVSVPRQSAAAGNSPKVLPQQRLGQELKQPRSATEGKFIATSLTCQENIHCLQNLGSLPITMSSMMSGLDTRSDRVCSSICEPVSPLLSSPKGQPSRVGTGAFLGGKYFVNDVIAFGGISEVEARGIRSSNRIRDQPNADFTQMERAQQQASARDPSFY
jgi:hypothetical protein